MITSYRFSKTTDDFTTTGNGNIIDVSLHPVSKFTLVVNSTGIVTSWIVELEGSIDGTNFTKILRHTELIGNNVAIYSGTTLSPCLFYRTRCTALTLGLGTKITTIVLGVP